MEPIQSFPDPRSGDSVSLMCLFAVPYSSSFLLGTPLLNKGVVLTQVFLRFGMVFLEVFRMDCAVFCFLAVERLFVWEVSVAGF